MIYLLRFIFGAIIGSFLNVVIFRFREDKPFLTASHFTGRSRCLSCKKNLSWKELIPFFSFLAQRGKCRNCGVRISWQYPLVEFLTGLVFALVPARIFDFYAVSTVLLSGGSSLWYYAQVFVWVAAFLIFILMAVIDYRLKLIPDFLNFVLFLLGLFSTGFISYFNKPDFLSRSFLGHYALLFGGIENIWLNHLFGAVVTGGFFAAIFFLSRGRGIGFGDAKLGAGVGMLMGWPDGLFSVFLAFIIGGAWGAAVMFLKKKGMKDILPFAPFFVIGITLTFFAGFYLLGEYFAIIGI
ncbi:MAG: prepilin peptidase [Candidatus Brennerbacteria bacterium]|nr:prepilin peptidase [Candidatus Brennerbacteria bacterium]